jgi:DNA-directed RNA polymerase subunit L
MELKVLEKTKSRLKIEVRGESHTLLNLLRRNSWDAKADQASYMIEYPLVLNSKIIIKAGNPKGVLSRAADRVIKQTQEFGRAFKRAR